MGSCCGAARWPAAGTCWRAAPTSCGSRRTGPPTGSARCAGLLASGLGRSAASGGRSQAARVPDTSSSREGQGEAPERQSRPQASRPLWSAAVRLARLWVKSRAKRKGDVIGALPKALKASTYADPNLSIFKSESWHWDRPKQANCVPWESEPQLLSVGPFRRSIVS